MWFMFWETLGLGRKISLKALIIGAAASGKSEYAERLLCRISGGMRRVYLATMDSKDHEAEARILRHRALRVGKGFITMEYPVIPEVLPLNQSDAVLLEDLNNLAANTLFSPPARPKGQGSLFDALLRLSDSCGHLVVVSCDLTRDGGQYPDSVTTYLSLLEALHQDLAERFDLVVEVVCGLPVVWKGEAP